MLTDISHLPDLNDSFMAFILRETQKGDEKFIEITHKGKLIWKEVLVYEYFERFIELGKIFKVKYGSRMIDLVPDVDGDYLYGDRIDARKKIEDFRRGLRFE